MTPHCILISAALLLSGCSGGGSTTESSRSTPAVPRVSVVPDDDEQSGSDETAIAESGWRTYRPKEPRKPEEIDRIHLEGVYLLTDPDQAAKRTSVASLGGFIKRVEELAMKALDGVQTEAAVLAKFTCTPESHTVRLAHQGDLSESQLQSFYDDLVALDPMPVSSGEVSFELVIEIEPVSPK